MGSVRRTKVFRFLFLLSVAGVTAIMADQDSEHASTSPLTARQLFYQEKPAKSGAKRIKPKPDGPGNSQAPKDQTPRDQTPPVAPAPYLALRYTMVQQNASHGFDEIDPGKTFHSNDPFRLKIEANSGAYLYVVVERGSKGSWEVLFPSPEAGETERKLMPREPVQIPQNTNFEFDSVPGVERLFVVLSREPEPDFEKLIRSIRQGQGGRASGGQVLSAGNLGGDKIESMRQKLKSRGIVRQDMKRDDKSGVGEAAVYVANASLTDNNRVVTEIVLKHE